MNTLNFVEEQKLDGLEEIKKLTQIFYKKKITIGYDAMIEDNKRRVIFTCSKSLRNYTFDSIGQECNGLILEASNEGWRPLVIPIMSPKSNVNTGQINLWLSKNLYEIYSMEDGTVINLYYYKNNWVISTARGIDMNNVVFNKLSYQEMLDQCLEKYDIYNFYDSLDKNKSYTLGFKHPDMHPFKEGLEDDLYKIWSIQSVQLNFQNFTPSREPFLEKLPTQKKYTFKTRNMHNLYTRLSSALEDYKNYNKKPNYGYILVSSAPETTKEFTVIMLESSLMNAIRNLWYNAAYIKYSSEKKYDKIKLILLNSYLDDTRAELFISLFPQYKKEFKRFDEIEVKLINDIYDSIKNKSEVNNNLVCTLANEVKININVELYENPLQKIRDIIHTNKYINAYYMFYYG